MNKKYKKILSYLASFSALTGVINVLPNNVTFAAPEKSENEKKAEAVIALYKKWLDDNLDKLKNAAAAGMDSLYGYVKDQILNHRDDFKVTYIDNFDYGDNASYKDDFLGIMEDFQNGIENYQGFGAGVVNGVTGLAGDNFVYLDSMISSYGTNKIRSGDFHLAKSYINKKLNPPNSTFDAMKYVGTGVGTVGALMGVSNILSAGMRSLNDQLQLNREFSRKASFQKVVDHEAKRYAKSICRDPKKINVAALCERLVEIGKSYPYAKKEFTVFTNALVGAILDKQNDPTAKCPPIILIGSPGCGKSRLIKEVVNAIRLSYEGTGWESDDKPKKRTLWNMLFGKKEKNKADPMKTGWEKDCVYICQDKIDKKSSVSPKDQLFGKHEEQKQDVKITVYSEDYIANNFGGDNIYFKFVDEFDKLDPAVLENCWDSADGGGKAIILGAANGLPTDYVDIKGASGKKAFLSRTVPIFLPSPDFSYYGEYINKGIDLLNTRGQAKIILSPEVWRYLSEQCVKEDAGMRSVIKMLTAIRGLQGQCDIQGINTVTLRGGAHPQDITCDELSGKQSNVEKLLDALKKKGITLEELNNKLLAAGFSMNDINKLADKLNKSNIDINKLNIDDIINGLQNQKENNNFVDEFRERNEGLVEA